ncbi:MAG: MBL fold metallo-hydrolase [Abditibacteriota bacterium]|nr:MBL fold metallo-hydrolase [Abditibacteriota bacterium]
MILTFLGTGTSNGVPIIGCHCPTCSSKDPKNHRYRCSVAIENEKGRVIIDTPPEFRLQCIRENIDKVDAVLLTHDHADHIFGLDDLRGFTMQTGESIPVYSSENCLNIVHRAFYYMFRQPVNKTHIPKLTLNILNKEPVNLIGIDFLPVRIKHGKLDIFAYKFGNVMYCTDCSRIPLSSQKHFFNLDVLILDCIKYAPHPTHLSLNQALRIVDKYKPKKAYFTHTTHYFEYNEVSELLPENVELAYDGLKINI